MSFLLKLLTVSLAILPTCACLLNTAFAQPLELQGAVGASRSSPPVPNHPADVLAVKNRLSNLGYNWLDASEQMNETTIYTIRLFQSIVRGYERVGSNSKYETEGRRYAEKLNN